MYNLYLSGRTDDRYGQMKSTCIKYVVYEFTTLFPLSIIYILSGFTISIRSIERAPEIRIWSDPLFLDVRSVSAFVQPYSLHVKHKPDSYWPNDRQIIHLNAFLLHAILYTIFLFLLSFCLSLYSLCLPFAICPFFISK